MEIMVLERLIQQAESAFERKEYLEGMQLLEEALIAEPNYGKAHNHMGWLYLYQIHDMEKAEKHLNYALKYSPNYSAPYFHMAKVLFDSRRFDELKSLLEKASDASVSMSFINNEYGRMYEVHGKMRKAVEFYKKAFRWSMDEQEMNVYKDNIRRCRDKRWILFF